MKELIISTVISGLFFLLFVATLILGFTKKNKKLKLTSLFLFFSLLGLTAWTGLCFVSKTYSKIKETLKPRTGNEIYDALFEKRHTNCINILNYQDQVIPKIDYAIWLQFETCPKELKRILSLHDFKTEIVSTAKWNKLEPLDNLNWFKPETLGDSILFCIYQDDYGNGQYIYCSLDSTQVFVKDILD